MMRWGDLCLYFRISTAVSEFGGRWWGVLTTSQVANAGDHEILVEFLDLAFFSCGGYSGEMVAEIQWWFGTFLGF